MKLIFEMKNGTPYLYREENSHFNLLEANKARTSEKLDANVIDEECDLTCYPDNFYMVFEIKKSSSARQSNVIKQGTISRTSF